MSFKVGELFLDLGIKGAEKTVGAVMGAKKALQEVGSTSLETKAAIVGAMYALQRLFAASGAMGTGLTNFNALTGLSAKQLQQWQFAARQAGVANEEFTGSVKSVQNAMTNMLLGKGAPEGLAMVANKVGFDAKRARDTFYVLQQLQKFAMQSPPDVGNAVLKSFGLGEGTISAMRRGMFNPAAFAKAPTYGDNEIKQLDRANIAWSNLATKIEMAFGRFNARHGGQLVSDISKIVDQVVKLAEAFTRLAEKLKVFEGIGKVFQGWSLIFENLSDSVDAVRGGKAGESIMEFFKEVPGVVGAMIEDFRTPSSVIAPNMPAPQPAPGSNQTINVNQNLNFQHDGKDAKKTSDSVKKANQDAFRQFNQGQVS